MVKQLKPLLQECISKNQRAFALGKSIHDNILIVHELLANFNKKKKEEYVGSMAVKLDLEKVYDLLSWDFIKAALSRFGFHDNWIQLIMECITSNAFSILINGEPKGFFQPPRGIRQGDALPPYTFI